MKCTRVIFIEWENVWRDLLTRSNLTLSKSKYVQIELSHTVSCFMNYLNTKKAIGASYK